MPLLSFLAPVEACKDLIAAALGTSRERTIAVGQAIDGILLGGRGFGVAMEGLINYLGSEYGKTCSLGYLHYLVPVVMELGSWTPEGMESSTMQAEGKMQTVLYFLRKLLSTKI